MQEGETNEETLELVEEDDEEEKEEAASSSDESMSESSEETSSSDSDSSEDDDDDAVMALGSNAPTLCVQLKVLSAAMFLPICAIARCVSFPFCTCLVIFIRSVMRRMQTLLGWRG